MHQRSKDVVYYNLQYVHFKHFLKKKICGDVGDKYIIKIYFVKNLNKEEIRKFA